MNNNETIFALSSGHGKSGVAAIRVSGDDLYNLFLQITNRKSADARHAYFANFRETRLLPYIFLRPTLLPVRT